MSTTVITKRGPNYESESFDKWWAELQARVDVKLAESEPDPAVFLSSRPLWRPLSESSQSD